MFDHLTNHSLLEDMLLDKQIFSLQHRVWNNAEELWRKWIRS